MTAPGTPLMPSRIGDSLALALLLLPPLRQPPYRAFAARQISGTFDSSVNTGAITLPGAEEWGWPSR